MVDYQESEKMDAKVIEKLSQRVGVSSRIVKNVLQLLDDGATVPFIARYRKEQTGSLDEVQISDIKSEYKALQDLIKRKEYVLSVIKDQDKLTPQLESQIKETWDATLLEDLYLPYKPKRKTRAMKAKELGLEPLAKQIMAQRQHDVYRMADRYIGDDVATADAAIAGAQDIIAEWISENPKTRESVRKAYQRKAVLTAKINKGKEADAMKYRDYFNYEEKLSKCPSHRLLAIRRAEDEGLLRVRITIDADETIDWLSRFYIKGEGEASDIVAEALRDAYKRLISPSIETEFRLSSKMAADQEAIQVFANNLKQLLLASPLGEKRVLALDPGYRTGCKLVCLDESGKLLHNTTIYPHPPKNDKNDARYTIEHLMDQYQVEAVAIGNGTAGRETYDFVRSFVAEDVEVYLVNEAGASIYSASEVAREEFPDHDITVRGAVSIGRRLMDPLAELVKIDPKSIGVGQYQHDVNQVMLRDSLTETVEQCVNAVGINVNTASASLLTFVSGLGPGLAQNIVKYRDEHGPYTQRRDLLDVSRMGSKAYEQSVGFLRIREGAHPLDNTGVHPERYELVETMARDMGVDLAAFIADTKLQRQVKLSQYVSDEVGMPTLKDIMKELAQPGLDPRGTAQEVAFDKNISSIDDLEVDMVLNGVVTNMTNFGAFVDIGIKGDGLVHISQITNRFIKNPAEVLQLGQEVKVKVIDLDLKRQRVNLSMKGVK